MARLLGWEGFAPYPRHPGSRDESEKPFLFYLTPLPGGRGTKL